MTGQVGNRRCLQGGCRQVVGRTSGVSVDDRTVEILRKCAKGGWTRFVRRLGARPKELVLEITEEQPTAAGSSVT
jgi:hypothetical protein